jgi:hypothetical protein
MLNYVLKTVNKKIILNNKKIHFLKNDTMTLMTLFQEIRVAVGKWEIKKIE